MNRLSSKLTSFLIAVMTALLIISTISGGAITARAAETASAAYEARNVMDDLKGATIDDEPLDLSQYTFDSHKNVQIISFVEFCYSPYEEKQSDYGLYVYVYNPRGLDWTKNERLNTIQFKYCDIYEKFSLEYLNRSEEPGKEGLFYKFKVKLIDVVKEAILAQLNSAARVYEVSGIELYDSGANPTEYKIANTYTYTGYAEGYGSDSAGKSTLICRVDGLEDAVELSVKHTYYRTKGDYYYGQQTQLNSCYFRVPQKYFTNYGELTKIMCEWYEYFTKPILVTENAAIYSALKSLNGGSLKNYTEGGILIMPFGMVDNSLMLNTAGYTWTSNVEMPNKYFNLLFGMANFKLEDNFDNFAAAFYTGANISFEDKEVTSEELRAKLLENSNFLGAPYLHGFYSEMLFTEGVNAGHTRGYNLKEITADDSFDLVWGVTKAKALWQKIFGGQNTTTQFDSVEAIKIIEPNDLKGTDVEISERLYVSKNDVKDIKAEYAKCQNERLVLFRYANSEYFSMPCYQGYLQVPRSQNMGDDLAYDYLQWLNFDSKNYTGYAFQETVYLGFDIISLTYELNNVETVIPVIMSPQDVISPGTPPLGSISDWWKYALVISGVLIGIIIVTRVVKGAKEKLK